MRQEFKNFDQEERKTQPDHLDKVLIWLNGGNKIVVRYETVVA